MTILPDWLSGKWTEFTARIEHLPHGILVCGPPGVGKRLLADALAARLLCSEAKADEHACGRCRSCVLRISGNHPDIRVLVPEASAEAQDETPSAKGVKASQQIRIEQVRDLQASLEVTSHLGGRRAVLIDPAEAMNPFTANALLKLLEEPPPATHLLLISSNPRRLLPTLRSRCQQWAVAVPPATQAQQWLRDNAPEEAAGLLDVVGGMPLEAARMAEQGALTAVQRFVSDIEALPRTGDAISLAGKWESWAKGKEGAASGMGMPRLSEWTQRWVWDLVAVRAQAPSRYFPGRRDAMRQLTAALPLPRLLDCYNEISQVRRSASHPLNLRLAIEDMLMRYLRCVSGERR